MSEARVLAGTGGQWRVQLADGTIGVAALRGKAKREGALKLVVGDHVTVEGDTASDTLAITAIHPRHAVLSRRNPSGAYGERIVAANLDQVIVVFAMVRPEPNVRMLDRFLVIAEANDLAAAVVVNKVDLASEDAAHALFDRYAALGYPVFFTSILTGLGVEALHARLHDRTSALSGPSGVGKSSLLNTMYPGLDLRVGEISASVNKGRHTTVGAWMHPLPDGGYVVDTPGLREVGLWGLPSASLDQCFPEIRARGGACRFSTCRHLSEPGCAVREGVTSGEVHPERYASYVKLREEVEATER
ncbi:MAG: ribosome small subunit-dependent GTPase A, partial [Gemmatimonadetes bacterium]|nr:ribosome small subunit-dependent GTPase A [Gemmatimonadota bacterium]